MAMTPGQKAQINMTPMIDILLVLIIIFMVIAPLASRGLHTLVPQPAPPDRPSAPPARDIVVTICADGTLRLNREPVARANLAARLSHLFQYAPDRVIFVRGEKGLEFQAVAGVIDIAQGAGFRRVALMTE